MPTILLFSTRETSIERGFRIQLLPDGFATLAPADNNGVGVSVTNGAGGKLLVSLWGAPTRARVAKCAAGAALFNVAGGSLSAVAPNPSQAPAAIALQCSAGDQTIEILPIAGRTRPDPAPAGLTSPASPVSRRGQSGAAAHTPHPGPAQEATMSKHYSDPIGTVLRKQSERMAEGLSASDALARVFEKENLHAQYAAAVRADATALPRAKKAEAERRIAEKMAAGMSRQKAAAMVFEQDPDLRRALIVGPAKPAAAAGRPAVVDEVEKRVEALKSRGMSHAKAVTMVFASDPDLHAKYRAAHHPV